jgi:hypothetical protein
LPLFSRCDEEVDLVVLPAANRSNLAVCRRAHEKEEIMKIRLFNSGDMDAIMSHAEERAQDSLIQPRTKEQAARWAEAVAREWCKPEDGYDEIDRQAYRAGWYHGMRKKKGW